MDCSAKVLKAFLDQKASEATSWARRGDTRYRGTQLRIACDNPYGEEIDLSGDADGSFLSVAMLYRLIALVFQKRSSHLPTWRVCCPELVWS